jgi:hypothetical protein
LRIRHGLGRHHDLAVPCSVSANSDPHYPQHAARGDLDHCSGFHLDPNDALVIAADLSQDTYYIVAHFHYVYGIGSGIWSLRALYYWIGKMSGRHYPEWAGKLHFWATFISANLTFFPMHMLGAAGMPRRYIDYPQPFSGWNQLISLGSYLGAAAFVFGMGVIIYTLLAGRRVSENNYWGSGATTLEWTLSSPPPLPHVHKAAESGHMNLCRTGSNNRMRGAGTMRLQITRAGLAHLLSCWRSTLFKASTREIQREGRTADTNCPKGHKIKRDRALGPDPTMCWLIEADRRLVAVRAGKISSAIQIFNVHHPIGHQHRAIKVDFRG